ncbi:MAG: hypothetical protein L0I62_02350 [Gammaproteobacteria bacterium]|nr:hypothetical protein [Gammaproteobacteria bacterium]
MRLQRFNDKGISAFGDYLKRLREEPALSPPFSLLQDPAASEPMHPSIDAEPEPFANRMEFARWLHEAASAADTKIPLQDAGFWSWLTLLLFDQVCPAAGNNRSVGSQARYIPDGDYRRQYRHLLATPYSIYYMHRDNPNRVRFLMGVPLNVFGELTEQFASRQELISCPGTMGLADYLFFDAETDKTRARAGGDAARRLAKLLGQYTRTWDITVMSPMDSANLLPSEFDHFKPSGM